MLPQAIVMLAAAVASVRSHKVAVIGGGIGGTASAYYLRQLMKSSPEVHVFEAEKVGGRLATLMIGGHEYEAGGSIIHPRNRHALDLVKQMGLKHRASPPESKTSLYDGKKVVFDESGWAWWDMLKIGLRYGPLSLYRANSQLQKMLGDFERIYKAQEKGQSFHRVSDFLEAMSPSFKDLASKPAANITGVSEEFIAEVVGAALRVNYAQWPKAATQFVAFVSLAAAEGGLWSIEGGNRRLPEKLLVASEAILRPLRVERVEIVPGGGFNLSWTEGSEAFDAVVVAAPLTERGGLQLPVPVQGRRMEGVWVTLVETNGPRSSYFEGLDLEDVVSVGPSWFNCLARVHPVNSDQPDPTRPVFKIFSGEKPSRAQVEEVLSGVGEMVQQHFWAYPHYEWSQSPDGPLQLLPGLVHTNALEWAASAIEMSALAAKNAALALADHLQHSEQTTPDFKRDELR